mgnify:CR=1 FL=1
MREILRLQEELAITMIYVTHDREEAFSLATRIAIMEDGKIRRLPTKSQTRAEFKSMGWLTKSEIHHGFHLTFSHLELILSNIMQTQ